MTVNNNQLSIIRRFYSQSFQKYKKLILMTDYQLLVAALLWITPCHGQSINELVNELAGSEADLIESEREEIIKKKEEQPSPPSSTEIIATMGEDDFAPEENIVTNGVTLQGLDKQTARVFIIDAHIGQTIEFGNLKIIVRHCEKAPVADFQESMAFISISEEKPKSPPENLFSGWMFASSPALSALDHPIYDVWVKECKEIK